MQSSQEIKIGRRMGRGVGRVHAGFTLIELLVAISILAVLIALAFGGFRMVGERMKGSATRQTMASLKSMLSEAEVSGLMKQNRQPAGVYYTPAPPGTPVGLWQAIRSDSGIGFQDSTGDNVPPMRPVADFWVLPDVVTDPGQTPFPLIPPNVPLEGHNVAVWQESAALKNTAAAVALLRGMPTIAKGMDALPGSTMRSAGFYASKQYPAGSRIVYAPPGNIYNSGPESNGYRVFKRIGTSTLSPTPPPALVQGDGTWELDWAAPIDAWGRPIIYVPASGLQVLVNDTTVVIVKSPEKKGFWASAGPDGRMDLGDDNVYSFD